MPNNRVPHRFNWWTTGEIELLKTQWQTGMPVTTWAHLLPRHTPQAIAEYARGQLKLPRLKEYRAERPVYPYAWAKVQAALEAAGGDSLTVRQLIARTGLEQSSVVRALRGNEGKLCHIADTHKSIRDDGQIGKPANEWALGPEPEMSAESGALLNKYGRLRRFAAV